MGSSEKSILFSPLKIRGVYLNNRIGVSPMGQYSADDGMANDWHIVNYGSFCTGGAGLVIVETTSVEARGRTTPRDLGLWKDSQIEPLKRITRFLKSHGSVPAIQLAHGGRKSSTLPPHEGNNSIADEDGGWPTIAPSALAFGEYIWKVPKVATIEDIQQITESFVSAAKRAVSAGFEVIELHYAHGYLISSFLSPISNKRTDSYGGSLENRMRFGLEIARSVRNALPEDIALGVRISVTDYVDNGWDVKQSIVFAEELMRIGIDFLDCSSGGVVGNIDYNPLSTPEIQIQTAALIQKETGLPTAAVGKIIDPIFAENILKENGATLILIGRAFLNNPHWPYSAADVLANEKSFKYPDQYNWCIGWKCLAKWRNAINIDKNNN